MSWGEVVRKRGSGTLNPRSYTLLNLNTTVEGKTVWYAADVLAWEGGRWERCNLLARMEVAEMSEGLRCGGLSSRCAAGGIRNLLPKLGGSYTGIHPTPSVAL